MAEDTSVPQKNASGINHASISAEQLHARLRGRNYAVFGGIMLLCVIFFIITIVRVGYGQ